MINIQRRSLISVRAESQSSSKLSNRDTGSTNGRLAVLGFVETTRDEDFAKQVAEGDVAGSFESKVDPSLDELILAGCHGCIKAHKVTLFDAVTEWTEQRFQAGKWREQGFAGEFVSVDNKTGDVISED